MGIFDLLKKHRDRHHPFCTAIVPAAGRSARMGGENKLFLELNGVPVLLRTLQAIDRAELVDEIIVATRQDTLLEVADLCARGGLNKPLRVVRGGESRTESVLAAAMEANPKTEFLAVHDGARPLVRPEEFDEIVRYGIRTLATAPALPVSDTIKTADEAGLVTGTPDRRTLFAIQTPQVFRAELLKAALQSAVDSQVELTDDCAAVERIGKQVYLTEGNRENIKITTPFDLDLAETILRRREEQV